MKNLTNNNISINIQNTTNLTSNESFECRKANWTQHWISLSALLIAHVLLFVYVIKVRRIECKRQKLNNEFRSKHIFEMQKNQYKQQHKKQLQDQNRRCVKHERNKSK